MKKMMIVVILCLMTMLFVSTTAFAADVETDTKTVTETDTDPLGMEAWEVYAEEAGFETYEGNACDVDALKYFDAEELADTWVSAWELEGLYIQIFRYQFTDSDSAAAMLQKAETVIKESNRTEIDRVEEEDYTIIKLVLDSDSWYMDLIQYGENFFFVELYDADGEAKLDELMENVFSAVELTDYYDIAEAAIEVLAEHWNDKYWDKEFPDKEYVLDIRSTRIIKIKDEMEEREEDYFGDVQYIVEFLFYDDYMSYGSISGGQNIGYYQTTGIDNNIVVYDDGSLECMSNFIRLYTSKTYNMDYSTFIDQVIDLHERYNQVIRFKDHQIYFEEK